MAKEFLLLGRQDKDDKLCNIRWHGGLNGTFISPFVVSNATNFYDVKTLRRANVILLLLACC